MNYIVTFLEGIISFISPCMLPMLPVYISYFAGHSETENEKKTKTVLKVIAFVIGFTLVFTLLGVFAGTLGRLLSKYQTAVNIASGTIVILFGLSYIGLFHIPFFKGMKRKIKVTDMFSAFIFGMVYSVSLTPCVGAFLGSALMIAASAGGALKGASLLFVYSLGLGIPFVFSAVLLDKLSGAFGWIKRHYKVINIISGIALIAVGILMMLGLLNTLLSISL